MAISSFLSNECLLLVNQKYYGPLFLCIDCLDLISFIIND